MDWLVTNFIAHWFFTRFSRWASQPSFLDSVADFLFSGLADHIFSSRSDLPAPSTDEQETLYRQQMPKANIPVTENHRACSATVFLSTALITDEYYVQTKAQMDLCLRRSKELNAELGDVYSLEVFQQWEKAYQLLDEFNQCFDVIWPAQVAVARELEHRMTQHDRPNEESKIIPFRLKAV